MSIYSLEDFFLHTWWISFMNNCIFHYIANACTHSDLEQCCVGEKNIVCDSFASFWEIRFLLTPLDENILFLKHLSKKHSSISLLLHPEGTSFCYTTAMTILFQTKVISQLQSENYFNQDTFSLLEFKYVAYSCIFLIKLKQ